jgi:excisionase family DNA binding protein
MSALLHLDYCKKCNCSTESWPKRTKVITERTLQEAGKLAEDLRRSGDPRSRVVEQLVAAVREDAVPALDLLTTTTAAEVFGVTAQTIKNWVRSGQLSGFRVGGRIMLPREAVMEYARQARASLDLEELSDDEAAALVTAERKRG